MNRNILFTLTLAGALIAGCTSTRGTSELSKLTTQEVHDFIIDGKTRKEDIIARFGTQCEVEEGFDGKEKWVYTLATYKPKLSNLIPVYGAINPGTNNKDYKLTIFFDQEGVVLRHRFDQKEFESTRWHSYHSSPR